MIAPAGRFESTLPSGLDRAAKEIYRNMRLSRASAREWLALTWPGPKTGPGWVAIWTQCSQIDSFVATLRQSAPYNVDVEDYIDTCLDADDGMESLLRAIAANLHFKRTGDGESADRMRGLVAPGDEIAPSWLLDSSTEYSRHIHRQKAYLHTTHKGDGGKGGSANPSSKGPKAKGPKAKGDKAKKGGGRGARKSEEEE